MTTTVPIPTSAEVTDRLAQALDHHYRTVDRAAASAVLAALICRTLRPQAWRAGEIVDALDLHAAERGLPRRLAAGVRWSPIARRAETVLWQTLAGAARRVRRAAASVVVYADSRHPASRRNWRAN